jgi:hypothetical protein
LLAVTPAQVADAPEGIELGRHRDLNGRLWHIWVRRGLLALVTVFVLLALAGVFGQRSSTASTESAKASLAVRSPTAVRGGLMWQARITVVAHQDVKNAILVLSEGWLNGTSINTIEPSPLGQGSRNGSLTLQLGHIPQGQRYILYMQLQTNPTTYGRRNADVQLEDDGRLLLSLHRSLTVFP